MQVITLEDYQRDKRARDAAQKALDAEAQRLQDAALARFVEEQRRADRRRAWMRLPFRLGSELWRVACAALKGER